MSITPFQTDKLLTYKLIDSITTNKKNYWDEMNSWQNSIFVHFFEYLRFTFLLSRGFHIRYLTANIMWEVITLVTVLVATKFRRFFLGLNEVPLYLKLKRIRFLLFNLFLTLKEIGYPQIPEKEFYYTNIFTLVSPSFKRTFRDAYFVLRLFFLFKLNTIFELQTVNCKWIRTSDIMSSFQEYWLLRTLFNIIVC